MGLFMVRRMSHTKRKPPSVLGTSNLLLWGLAGCPVAGIPPHFLRVPSKCLVNEQMIVLSPLPSMLDFVLNGGESFVGYREKSVGSSLG